MSVPSILTAFHRPAYSCGETVIAVEFHTLCMCNCETVGRVVGGGARLDGCMAFREKFGRRSAHICLSVRAYANHTNPWLALEGRAPLETLQWVGSWVLPPPPGLDGVCGTSRWRHARNVKPVWFGVSKAVVLILIPVTMWSSGLTLHPALALVSQKM